MQSKAYDYLEKRIKEIEIGLGLTQKVSVDTDLSGFQELTKAYILLCHAEIEKYFEMICTQTVFDSKKQFSEKNDINSALLSVASVCEYTIKGYNEKDNAIVSRLDPKVATLEGRISNAYGKFITVAKGNNGIKTKDILNLLWPLGINENDVDTALLNALNSLGEKRGRIAHTGAAINKVTLNYDSEKKTMGDIITEIKAFDSLIMSKNYLNADTSYDEIENILY